MEEEKKEGKEEKKEEKKVTKKGKKRTIRYLDNLCADAGLEKNDTEYVRQSFRYAIKEGYFDG